MQIERPIEQRNTGKGNPNAILHFDRPLSARQVRLLAQLPEYDSRAVVRKRDVNMRDLAALTAFTGVEYAMFTKRSERFVIRGNAYMTNIDIEAAQKLAREGYRWCGHTHPGMDINVRTASPGDYEILHAFGQKYSVVYDAMGRFEVFGGD